MEVRSVTSNGQVTRAKELRRQPGVRQDAVAHRQRQAARPLFESGRPLRVSKSVVLELEWVMRGCYPFAQADVAAVTRHLLEPANIVVEDRHAVEQAFSNCVAGIDFADALHRANCRSCDSVSAFQDRRFARRAKRLGLAPAVLVVPQPAG